MIDLPEGWFYINGGWHHVMGGRFEPVGFARDEEPCGHCYGDQFVQIGPDDWSDCPTCRGAGAMPSPQLGVNDFPGFAPPYAWEVDDLDLEVDDIERMLQYELLAITMERTGDD